MSSLRKMYDTLSHQSRAPAAVILSKDGLNVDFEANGDYSGAPQKFLFQAVPNRKFAVSRITVEVSDNGTLGRNNYGSINNGLNNGIVFYTVINGVETIISNPPLIKTNGDYLSASNVFEIVNFDGGVDSVFYALDFSQFADPVVLNGDLGDMFGVILNDNFSTLVAHKFTLLTSTQGPIDVDLP